PDGEARGRQSPAWALEGAEGGTPRGGGRRAIGVVEEHRDAGPEILVELPQDALGGRLLRPVLAPRRPQDSAQAQPLGGEKPGVREGAERWAVPPRHLTGRFGDGVDTAEDVVPHPPGRREQLGTMVVAVSRDLVAGGRHLGRDAPVHV